MRFVPRATVFSGRNIKDKYLLSEGRLFGLKPCGDGLVPAFGISLLTMNNIPSSVQAVYLTSAGNLYVYSGGSVYRSTGAYGNFYLYGSGFSNRPFFAECHEDGEYFTIICDGVKSVIAKVNSAGTDDCPPVSYGVVHYNRMFGIDSSDARVMRWSAPGDVHDWSESINGAGHVRLDSARGDIIKLMAYDNKLIAVREYGFTVLRAFGEAESFRADVTDTSTDEIVGDTVAFCSGRLYFFTATGLYSYDGDVEKCAVKGLEGFTDAVCAAACGGYYYVGGKLDGEDAIACVDVKEGEVCFIKAKATVMCGGARVFFYGDGLYEITPAENSVGEWESGPLDFGTPQNKYLKSVSVYGADTLTVSSGERMRTYADVNGEVNVDMPGREFRFSASCSEKLRMLCARYVIRG